MTAADDSTSLEAKLEVKQGFPGHDELLSLLNDAFDGWGTDEYFRWKYDQYPRYDKREHNFYAATNGDVIACRRLFPVELLLPDRGDSVEFFVHGGAAVAQEHRGQGLFSRLVDDSWDYSRQEGAPLVMTFNRKGKISTKAHLNHGWDYRVLPIRLRILSPSAVIGEHAQTVLGDHALLEQLATTLADRVATSDGRLELEECSNDASGQSVPDTAVRLSDRAVKDIVEIASDTHDASTAAAIVGRLLRDREISIDRSTGDATPRDRTDTPPADELPGVTVADELSATELADIQSLFDEENQRYDLAFRRNEEDIVHQTQFPASDVLTVTDGDQTTGYAVLGLVQKGTTTEARVLDAVCESSAAFEIIAQAISRCAIANNADVIIWSTRRNPGEQWARIDTEYAMWDWIDRDDGLADRLQNGTWRISMYDIL